MAASEAYVIDAVRTAVGKKGGALAGYHPIDLGVEAYRGIFARNDIDPAAFDDVIVGCVDAIGGQAGNIGRLTWLAAGYDEDVAMAGQGTEDSVVVEIKSCSNW